MLAAVSIALVAIGLVACPAPAPSQAASPVDAAPPPDRAADSAPPSERVLDAGVEARARAFWPEFPTLQNAGANACILRPVVALGPSEQEPIVGFGPMGGLAAWKPDPTTIALQSLASDASLRGGVVTVPTDSDRELSLIFPVDRGFVVILRRWDWQRSDVRWWGLVAGHDAKPLAPAVDLGLASLDVRAGQAVDGGHVVLLASPAALSPPDARAPLDRWETLTIGDDGGLQSSGSDVQARDLVSTGGDVWEPARLGGEPGWAVLRDGALRPEGVFGGKRVSSAGALVRKPHDGVEGVAMNLARPPPPGPGNTIYEPVPRPALLRTHAGKPVGEVTLLQVRFDGMYMPGEIVWSGSLFVYPHRASSSGGSSRVAALLPVDCRK